MDPTVLLHWHYLIFLVPCVLAGSLLLLSSLRLGHGHGVHAGHGHGLTHGHVPTHTGAGTGPAATSHAAGSHVAAHTGSNSSSPHASGAANQQRHGSYGIERAKRASAPANALLTLIGAGRAPLPLIVEAFFMVWGLSGCIALQLMIGSTTSPTPGQILPVAAIAAGCGFIGARLAAELMARLMPDEESSVVSREGLYGLKGTVTFPVSDGAGRILVYDDFGSIHDESCRVAPGQPAIGRGRHAMVMDRDGRGNLLVEEVPD